MNKTTKTFEDSMEYDLFTSDFGNAFLKCYEILEKIHDSKWNQIYIVRSKEFGNLFVLKVIDKSTEYVYDIDSIRRISHKNIVEIHDIQQTEKYIYLIKEYVKGCTMEELIHTNGPLSEEEAIEIFLIISDIFEYLHAIEPSPLIYRDLKPANLIMGENGEIKLIDLDSIRQYKSTMQKDTFYIGTAGFAAPEQFGFSQTDSRSDIFTLGATMFFLVTGQMPTSDLLKASNRKGSGINISVELMKVIEKCMNFHPEKRYQTASELRQQLLKLKRAYAMPKFSRLIKRNSGLKQRTIVALLILMVLSIPLFKLIAHGQGIQFLSSIGGSKSGAPEVVKLTKTELHNQGMVQTTPSAMTQNRATAEQNAMATTKISPSPTASPVGSGPSSVAGKIDAQVQANQLSALGAKQTPATAVNATNTNKDSMHESSINNQGKPSPSKSVPASESATPISKTDETKESNAKDKFTSASGFSYNKTTITEAFWAGSMPKKMAQVLVDYYKSQKISEYDRFIFYLSIAEWDNGNDQYQMRERIDKVGGNLILRAEGHKDVKFVITSNCFYDGENGRAYEAHLEDGYDVVTGVKYKIVDPSGHWLTDSDVVVVRPASHSQQEGGFSYDKTTIKEAFWSGTLPQKLDSRFCEFFKSSNGYVYKENEFYVSIEEWDSRKDYHQMGERIKAVGGKMMLKAEGYKDIPVQITDSSMTYPDSGYVYVANILDLVHFETGVRYQLYDSTGHWIVGKEVYVVRPKR